MDRAEVRVKGAGATTRSADRVLNAGGRGARGARGGRSARVSRQPAAAAYPSNSQYSAALQHR